MEAEDIILVMEIPTSRVVQTTPHRPIKAASLLLYVHLLYEYSLIISPLTFFSNWTQPGPPPQQNGSFVGGFAPPVRSYYFTLLPAC